VLLTPRHTEERIWHYVRDAGTVHATAEEIARATGTDVDDARHHLDELVARSVLRRFDTPGQAPVYWS
jgi:predicted ArsR family transcriptional regulator